LRGFLGRGKAPGGPEFREGCCVDVSYYNNNYYFLDSGGLGLGNDHVVGGSMGDVVVGWWDLY
jgi:hypothetical protein